ncbi:hypothetical protein Tco_0195652 [Tanacetum coccineum]
MMRRVQSFVPMGSELEVQRLKRVEAYQIFADMLKKFDKDDLVNLWDLVKERFSTTEPTDDKEKKLWVELNRLFKPNNDDILWKLQRYMHDPLVWRLYDTCGVHHVSSVRGHNIFMLVEKEYLLTRGTLGLMMVARLLVKADSEMSRELLRKIFYQANKPRHSLYRRHYVVMISILVTPRVSVLAGCDILVSEPLVIEKKQTIKEVDKKRHEVETKMIAKDGTVSKSFGKFPGYTPSKEEEEEPENKGSKEAPEKGPNYKFLSYAVSDSDSDLESTAKSGPKCNELEDTCENRVRPNT